MKKFLFIIFTIIIIISIYFLFDKKKVYYLNINTTPNNEYSIYFSKKISNLKCYKNIQLNDYRTTDLINIIKNNTLIEGNTINNLLIKANIITLWTGMNELNYKINSNKDELYDYSDELLNDIENLIIILRKYSKEKIIMLNFYNPNNKIDNNNIKYLNEKLNIIGNKYNIKILDISSFINSHMTNYDHIYISNELLKY